MTYCRHSNQQVDYWPEAGHNEVTHPGRLVSAESLEEKTAPGAGSVRVPRVCTAFLLLVVLTIANARAQTPKAQTLHPLAPSDTSSPRATFTSFLAACDELYAVVSAPQGANVRTAPISFPRPNGFSTASI